MLVSPLRSILHLERQWQSCPLGTTRTNAAKDARATLQTQTTAASPAGSLCLVVAPTYSTHLPRLAVLADRSLRHVPVRPPSLVPLACDRESVIRSLAHVDLLRLLAPLAPQTPAPAFLLKYQRHRDVLGQPELSVRGSGAASRDELA